MKDIRFTLSLSLPILACVLGLCPAGCYLSTGRSFTMDAESDRSPDAPAEALCGS